jgi:hypothetical protein
MCVQCPNRVTGGDIATVERGTGVSRQTRKQAVAEHKAAKTELERISKQDRTETDEYLAANRRVIETEKHVPWWRR